MYDNRGRLEYQDFPSIAKPPQTEPLFVSPSSFGGTLRQSQIRLQAFGPDISGARTSADLQFDFAGGLPNKSDCAGVGPLHRRTWTRPRDLRRTLLRAVQDPQLFQSPRP